MYRVGLIRSFQAVHFLVGTGRGDENLPHTHPYRMEWILEGPELDGSGFLVDLSLLDRLAEETLELIQDQSLNGLPEFQGVSPTVERLARFLAERFAAARTRWDPERRIKACEVKVFESDREWGSWSEDLPGRGR